MRVGGLSLRSGRGGARGGLRGAGRGTMRGARGGTFTSRPRVGDSNNNNGPQSIESRGRGRGGRGQRGQRGRGARGKRRAKPGKAAKDDNPVEAEFKEVLKEDAEARATANQQRVAPFDVHTPVSILKSMRMFRIGVNRDSTLRLGFEGINMQGKPFNKMRSLRKRTGQASSANFGAKDQPPKRDAISWGIHNALYPEKHGDTVGTIQRYTSRNETYIKSDGDSLVGKVQSLLPVSPLTREGSSPSAKR